MKKLSFLFAALVAGVSFISFGADTPPEGADLVDLTTATSGSVVADTNPHDNGSYRGAKAFDDKTSGGSERWLAKKGADDKPPTYVIYKFNEPTTVNAYHVYNGGSGGANQTTRAPKKWTLEGSNDNESWVLLDSRSEETKWSSGEVRYFACSESANVGKYSYYRLTLLENNGDTIYQIHEICFYYVISFSLGECSAVRETDGSYTVSGIVERGSVDSVTAFARTDDGSKTIEVQIGTDVAPDEEVSGTLSGLETGLTYELSIGAKKGDDEIEKPIDVVYAGELALTFVSNAKEMGCVPGIVKVSRANASKYPLVVNYTLTDGTAKAGTDYVPGSGTVTIPANESECIIEIIPMVNPDVTVDTDLTVSIASGNYAAPANGVTMTIENAALPDGVNVWVAGSMSDGLASTAGNWSLKVAPTAGNADSLKILVDGVYSSHDMTWDAGVNGLPDAVTSWTQTEDYTGTVTILTTFPNYANSTFKTFTVAGAMTVDGGTVTHSQSVDLPNDSATYTLSQIRSKYAYRLCLSVGSLVVGAGGKIDAKGKGHRQSPTKSAGRCPGYVTAHGGRYDNSSFACYGNVKYPEDIGMAAGAGTDGSGSKHAAGGGAIKITSSGACVINGEISVDGLASSGKLTAAAAGSILIEAPSVSGSGSIHADGPYTGNNSYRNGAGGRIAILTTTPIDTDTLTVSAGSSGSGKYGAEGTVYLKDSTMTDGVLYLNNPLFSSSNSTPGMGAYVTNEEGVDWKFDSIKLNGHVNLYVPAGTTLTLPNGFASVSAPKNTSRVSGIYYRGGTIDVGSGDQTIGNGYWYFFPSSNFVFSANLTVGGNAAIGGCGYWEQSAIANNAAPTTSWKTLFEVVGDMTIEEDGVITADSAGLGQQSGAQYEGVAIGAHGGRRSATGKTMDSVFEPHVCGVYQSNSYGYVKAGGVLDFTVGGCLTVDGNIHSDSPDTADGGRGNAAGGAINIKAGSIAGTGTISASAKRDVQCGGRVAIKLTESGATFDDFAGSIYANGGGSASSSSAGSIYLQDGVGSERCGVITIDNKNKDGLYTPICATGYEADSVADFKKAQLVLSNKGRAQVSVADADGNFKMSSLSVDSTSQLDLFGKTLTVNTAKLGGTKLKAGTYAAGDAALGDFVIDSVGGGSLVVKGSGLMLLVR